MKKFLLVLTSLLLTGSQVQARNLPIEEIVQKLRAAYSTAYRSYSGYQVTQESTVIITDAKTGAPVSTVESTVLRNEYFLKKAERVAVYRYIKDGVEQPVEKYSGQRDNAPAYPFFDEKSDTHYRFELAGIETMAGRECYNLKIIPREATERHLQGNLYVTTAGLETVLFSGSPAKYSFGLKSAWFVINFARVNGYDLPVANKVKFTVDIPVVFPNKQFDITSKLSGHRFLE